MRRVDLVSEAAVERMDLKMEVFRELEGLTRSDTILATNTSALSITHLADALDVPERVVGIHFFNPVHRMQLVEVIRGAKTDPEVLQRSVRFVQGLGKLPVVVRDSPGFIVNRILMPYLMEAARLFERGARIGDIDEAMLDFGMPMGPLRLVDEVGIDVAWHVSGTLSASFTDHLTIPTVLKALLDKGHLGKKSGQGFYQHGKGRAQPRDAEVRLMRDDHAANLGRDSLQGRMVLLMLNEAARCLEEGIVEAPEDIDFAMVMGTGFAPFRGGPLRHADTWGLRRVVDEMETLAATEYTFQPCDLLRSMAAGNRRFYPNR
jgi:3-hydroxyacyl-CoA dehydrogenase/enoyl-CoA hydratase/3-hydroxybutyryl-CoA epimerase